MSVDWGVIPSQPDNPGFQEWFREAGLDIPSSKGRYPTFDEFVKVLKSFSDNKTKIDQINDNLFEIIFGDVSSSDFAQILGSNQEDGLFHFQFLGYSTKEVTMLKILRKTSHICGPIALYESHNATPVLVDESTDIEEALKDWRIRYKNKYPVEGNDT